MKHCTMTDGFPTAFFDSEINQGAIPDVARAITDEQWQDLIDHPGRRRFNVVSEQFDEYMPAPNVDTLKLTHRNAVDYSAEQTRMTFITPGAGQALVYQRKQRQARECLAAHDAQNPPTLGSYPALDAEIGITGADTLAVAQVVADLADAWGSVADTIEVLRLTAKAAIDAVPDDAADIEAQIAAIEAGIVWPVNV